MVATWWGTGGGGSSSKKISPLCIEILLRNLLNFFSLYYNKTYCVKESYKRGLFSPPKTGKQRIIRLPEFFANELKQHIKELRKESLRDGRGGKINLLFVDKESGEQLPISQRKIQGLVTRVCKRAGLRRRRPHDFRHTYATLLLMNNESPVFAQKQLGHHSIQTTVDIYGHLIPSTAKVSLESAFEKKHEIPPSNREAIYLIRCGKSGDAVKFIKEIVK